MKVRSGTGLGSSRDGLTCRNTNVLACYTHIHADGVDSWVYNGVQGRRSRCEA